LLSIDQITHELKRDTRSLPSSHDYAGPFSKQRVYSLGVAAGLAGRYFRDQSISALGFDDLEGFFTFYLNTFSPMLSTKRQ